MSPQEQLNIMANQLETIQKQLVSVQRLLAGPNCL